MARVEAEILLELTWERDAGRTLFQLWLSLPLRRSFPVKVKTCQKGHHSMEWQGWEWGRGSQASLGRGSLPCGVRRRSLSCVQNWGPRCWSWGCSWGCCSSFHRAWTLAACLVLFSWEGCWRSWKMVVELDLVAWWSLLSQWAFELPVWKRKCQLEQRWWGKGCSQIWGRILVWWGFGFQCYYYWCCWCSCCWDWSLVSSWKVGFLCLGASSWFPLIGGGWSDEGVKRDQKGEGWFGLWMNIEEEEER